MKILLISVGLLIAVGVTSAHPQNRGYGSFTGQNKVPEFRQGFSNNYDRGYGQNNGFQRNPGGSHQNEGFGNFPGGGRRQENFGHNQHNHGHNQGGRNNFESGFGNGQGFRRDQRFREDNRNFGRRL